MNYRVIVEAQYDDEDLDDGSDPADPKAPLAVEKVTAFALGEMLSEAGSRDSGGLVVRAVPCGDDGEPIGPTVTLTTTHCKDCGQFKASVIAMQDE